MRGGDGEFVVRSMGVFEYLIMNKERWYSK